MAGIEKIYLGSQRIDKIYLGENLVSVGLSSNATSAGVLYPNLPEIANPVDSIVPIIPSTNFPSVSQKEYELLGALGLASITLQGFSIDCEGAGTLPTKAEIVEQFNKIAQIPAKLKQKLIEAGEELEAEVRQQIEDIVKKIEDVMEKIADILSPYWTKGKIRNWQKEAKDAWDELIQELHIFIPVKILEMISKLIPIDFKVNVLGIEINLLKITEAEEQLRIQTEIVDRLEELFPLLPKCYQFFNGEFGIKCDEWRAKYTWQYIKNEIIQWCTNTLFKAFEKLIDKFKEIWEALGLPPLPAILSFDIEEWIQLQIDTLKAKAIKMRDDLVNKAQQLQDRIENLEGDLQAELDDIESRLKNFSVTGYIVEQLEQIEIFGKKLVDILGKKIDENVLCGEELIADLVKQAREWFAQWQKELIFMWIKKIKKFLDKIGLGKILDLLTLTFCDVLKLIGIPTSFDLKLSV